MNQWSGIQPRRCWIREDSSGGLPSLIARIYQRRSWRLWRSRTLRPSTLKLSIKPQILLEHCACGWSSFRITRLSSPRLNLCRWRLKHWVKSFGRKRRCWSSWKPTPHHNQEHQVENNHKWEITWKSKLMSSWHTTQPIPSPAHKVLWHLHIQLLLKIRPILDHAYSTLDPSMPISRISSKWLKPRSDINLHIELRQSLQRRSPKSTNRAWSIAFSCLVGAPSSIKASHWT